MDHGELIILGNGFLGSQFKKNGYRVLSRKDVNFVNDESFIEFSSKWLKNKPEIKCVINCIGNADTRNCENLNFWNDVFFTNSIIPKKLSKLCRHYGKKFVQISTGCVYDQNSRPNTEEDSPSSHCNYVVSKICAENFCDSSGDLIIRPRLFFGETDNKNNLLCKLPKFEKHLNEINSYTSLQTIVEAVDALIQLDKVGVYNVAQEGYATIGEICEWIGLEPKPKITGLELQKDQNLNLVNNILDISKLKKIYEPRPLKDEIINNWNQLTKYKYD